MPGCGHRCAIHRPRTRLPRHCRLQSNTSSRHHCLNELFL